MSSGMNGTITRGVFNSIEEMKAADLRVGVRVDVYGGDTYDIYATNQGASIPLDNGLWADVVVSNGVTPSELTTAQGDVLGGKLFKGSNGETVENGDVVDPGTTHLRVLVGGKPAIVLIAPSASGTVSLLTEVGATVGTTPVKFIKIGTKEFEYLYDSNGNLIVDGAVFVDDRVVVDNYHENGTSGTLFFRASATNAGLTVDGGKCIHLPSSGLYLIQNLKKPYNPASWGAHGDGVKDDTEATKKAVAYLSDGDSMQLPNKLLISVTDRMHPDFTQTSAFFSQASNVKIKGPCEITQVSNGQNVQNVFLFKNPTNVTGEEIYMKGYGDHIDDGTSELYSGYIMGGEGVCKNFKLINSRGEGGLGGIRNWDQSGTSDINSENIECLDCVFENVRYPILATNCRGVKGRFSANGVHRAFFCWDSDGVEFDYTVSNCFPSVLRLTGDIKNASGTIRHIENPNGKLAPDSQYSNVFQILPTSTGGPFASSAENIDVTLLSDDTLGALDIGKAGDSISDIRIVGRVSKLNPSQAAIFAGQASVTTEVYKNLTLDLDVDVVDPGDTSISGLFVGQISNWDRVDINMRLTNPASGGRGVNLIACDKTFAYGDYRCPSIGFQLQDMGASVITGHVFTDAPIGANRTDPQGAGDTLLSTSY